jgi:16S rRNA (guanine966-N2)-methyltransferase
MIISSGWAKGMKLKAPAGIATRPTSAKVRAAALNMLAPLLEDAHFLDVFAGSGAMGIESMSRGAASCAFVESGRSALQCLNGNLAELKRRAAAQSLPVPDVRVVSADASRVPALLSTLNPPDLIFVDPPYHQVAEWIDRLIEPLAAVIQAQAVLVLEHDNSPGSVGRIERGVAGWILEKQKSYGETMLSLFTREGVE